MQYLKKIVFVTFVGLSMTFATGTVAPASADAKSGEAGFKKYCAACHADGGNIVNPKKTLSRADREKNGVNSAAAIVKLMRNPGPGMTPFPPETIPERDAKEIAGYVLATFR